MCQMQCESVRRGKAAEQTYPKLRVDSGKCAVQMILNTGPLEY